MDSQSLFSPAASAWWALVLVFLYLGALITIAELINRWTQTDGELTRKIVHIGSGNVILFAWWLDLPASVISLAAAIAALIALSSYYLPILPSLNSVGRQSLGTFFYAVSIGLLTAWFWPINQPQYAVIGILIMTWGDGLAAVVGQKFGKHPYQFWGSQKSWEGSLTMLLASFLVTILILGATAGLSWHIWLISFATAMIATSLETFSKLGIDNLTVPIASAAFGFFASRIL